MLGDYIKKLTDKGYKLSFENPISPLIGGAPAGVFSCIFAIVEFADGVERVDPTRVHFCDESNDILNSMNGEVSNE